MAVIAFGGGVANGWFANFAGPLYGYVIGVVGPKISIIPAYSNISFHGMMTPKSREKTFSIQIALQDDCVTSVAEAAGATSNSR